MALEKDLLSPLPALSAEAFVLFPSHRSAMFESEVDRLLEILEIPIQPHSTSVRCIFSDRVTPLSHLQLHIAGILEVQIKPLGQSKQLEPLQFPSILMILLFSNS